MLLLVLDQNQTGEWPGRFIVNPVVGIHLKTEQNI